VEEPVKIQILSANYARFEEKEKKKKRRKEDDDEMGWNGFDYLVGFQSGWNPRVFFESAARIIVRLGVSQNVGRQTTQLMMMGMIVLLLQ
jgi:hypothetical protein